MKSSYALQKRLGYLLSALAAVGLFLLLHRYNDKGQPPGKPRDYAAIAAEGILRIATEYNSIGFYVEGDTLAGFHYELMKAFARDKGLIAQVTPLMSFDERLAGLATGRYDMIAADIPTTSELKDSLLLTTPLVLNKQVLVQRKATETEDSLYIHNQLELAQRTLYVVKGSPALLRIRNLGNEMGDTIYVKEIEKYGPEQLMALVAHGDIDYAVCDENIARAVADSLPQLDIRTAIGFTQFCSWAVSKQSPALLDSVNQWLEEYQKEEEYQQLHKKYYAKK